MDARGRLDASRDDSEPFDFRQTKSGELMIFRGGRVVTTLGGARAAKLVAALAAADGLAQQLLLAKATGHYKH